MLNKLVLLLKSNPFKKEDEENNNNKITNAYSEAILTKYEQTLLTFESLHREDTRIGYYRKQFKNVKFQRIKGKHQQIIITVIALALIMAIKSVKEKEYGLNKKQ